MTSTITRSSQPPGHPLHGQCIANWSIQTTMWRADITNWIQKPTNVIWTNVAWSCQLVKKDAVFNNVNVSWCPKSWFLACKGSHTLHCIVRSVYIFTGTTLRPATAWPSQTGAHIVFCPSLYCVRYVFLCMCSCALVNWYVLWNRSDCKYVID